MQKFTRFQHQLPLRVAGPRLTLPIYQSTKLPFSNASLEPDCSQFSSSGTEQDLPLLEDIGKLPTMPSKKWQARFANATEKQTPQENSSLPAILARGLLSEDN